MENKNKNSNERIVGVVKHLKGKDLDISIRKELGVKDEDYVNRVVKENSPRTTEYVKSYGRFLDLVRNL